MLSSWHGLLLGLSISILYTWTQARRCSSPSLLDGSRMAGHDLATPDGQSHVFRLQPDDNVAQAVHGLPSLLDLVLAGDVSKRRIGQVVAVLNGNSADETGRIARCPHGEKKDKGEVAPGGSLCWEAATPRSCSGPAAEKEKERKREIRREGTRSPPPRQGRGTERGEAR